jgi:integral membrane sensor domain MASE1
VGDAAAPPRGHPARRALIATLLVCGGYYAGGAIGMGMRLVPGGPTEIWLPQGILLAALLTAPVRRWWLYAVALLPTHGHLTAALNPHVPAPMMFVQFAGQFVQAAVAAALLRPILGNPPRLDSLRRMGAFALEESLPYDEMRSLSYEARQKLSALRPRTLAHAASVPGVSPTDLQNLVIEIEKRRRRDTASTPAAEPQ